MGELDDYGSKLSKILAEHRLATRQAAEEKDALETAKKQLAAVTQAQMIVQQVAEKVQESAHQQIAGVVSRCLEAVFGEDAYQFHIKFVKRRNKTEAELLFIKDGLEIDPLTASGGGAVDVAAFALRLACLMLSRPRRRRFLCMDEPFRNIHGEMYQQRVGEMLLELCREMKIQMLIISDDSWMKIGKVIEL